MRRMVAFILATIMLIACSSCFWGVEGEGHGDRDRREHGDPDRGGHGGRDRGGYGEHEDRR